MKSSHDQLDTTLRADLIPKPYASVGAGELTSFLWKTGDQDAGWRYRFNIFRLAAHGSRVTQLFRPQDIFHLVKLTQVLASVLADDGCLSPLDRGLLQRLANDLDALLFNASKNHFKRSRHDGQSTNS